MTTKTLHYHGHRQRLKEKFRQHGADSLADYELLELLLMQAIPRRDVKPLAKELIETFGSFTDVMNTSLEELSSHRGMGEGSATSIKLAQGIAVVYRKGNMHKKQAVENKLDLLDYLYTKMNGLKHEEFHVVYLDSRNNILSDEMLFRGTVNSSAVYPREIARAALKNGAVGLVLVHNHPSGNPSPSQDDEVITMDICSALASLDISVYDHIIIGDNIHYSFKDHGKL